MTADWEPEVDDIAALRRENGGRDLKEFMRRQIATGKARREPPKPTTTPRPPGHRPGTWPTGTSPPGPRPPVATDAQWAQALHDFRTGRKSDHDPCECGACPPPDKTRKETR